MKDKELSAFKDGVANALLDGNVNEDVKDKYCRHSYQQGYDFGLTMYCRYNKLDQGQRLKMKINEWGVFVERPDTSTYEIRLSEELASKVSEYIEKLKEDDEYILSGNTKGKILW